MQGDRCLSYAELDAHASRWAAILVARGVEPEELVGVAAEHSFEAVVALLGILKAGAAYLPIDPELPPERLSYILADARPRLVLSDAAVAPRMRLHTAVEVVQLDASEARLTPEPRVQRRVDARQLAYCIYTSGSTGTPKGTLVQHQSVVNHSAWMRRTLGIDESDRVLQHTTLSFDAAVCEFWVPLLCGARLVLPSREALGDAELLLGTLERESVSFFQAVPSLLRGLLALPSGERRLRAVRHLISGGEALPPELLDRLLEGRSAPLYNLYGPTEATVDATYRACTAEDAKQDSVSIGVAIDNASAWVLDRNSSPLPDGVPGEL
jgi:amino acid adenylation domain-containing protein